MSRAARRQFLRQVVGVTVLAGAGTAVCETAAEDGRPPVTRPRATSGDEVSEPDWAERLTITVGPRDADLVGTSQRVLQAAVDYVAQLGGGTVRILPGEYRLRGAVRLRSHVRLVGSGADTRLVKPPSHSTRLSADSDWFDQEITLVDPAGFAVGDWVCLRTKNPHHGATTIAKRVLVARDGHRFKLDRALRENFWQLGDTTVSSLYPLVTAEEAVGLTIEDLTLDGNRAQNDNLDGNYAGCIFLQDCQRVALRRITASHYNGDGISWQICHDVTVEDCHSHDHAGLGLHPGSGSQRPLIRRNRLERNQIGLFFCWGVRFGLAEHNRLDGNRCGISLGHRDTDNVVRHNEVLRSQETGVLFRPERGPAFAAHRNRIEHNQIVDSGGDTGVAIDVQGATQEVALRGNQLSETRGPAQRVGIRLGAETREIAVEGNQLAGFSRDIDDRR
ncbi:MAG: right-handed parallel beta-helix repeat-containing protein [Pirellulales bacterium]